MIFLDKYLNLNNLYLNLFLGTALWVVCFSAIRFHEIQSVILLCRSFVDRTESQKKKNRY